MAENNPFDNVRPPFSAYDFFAHLIPGLTFFACLYIFEVGIDKNDLIQDAFFSNYNIRWLITETRPAPDVNFLRNAGFLLISILFVYAISHVIASISSFFIDRLLIYKGFGYPYRFLVLGESYKKLLVGKQIRRKYYQGIFFWGNFCLLAIYFSQLYLRVFSDHTKLAWISSIVAFVVFFVCPIVARGVIGAWHHFRRKHNDKYQLPLPLALEKRRIPWWSWLETRRPEVKRRYLLSAVVFAAPFHLVANFVQKILRTDRDLEKPVREKYCAAFLQQFGIESSVAGNNNYWFSFFYVMQYSPRLSKLIANLFHQYSFARNMATAFYLAFAYCVIFVWNCFESEATMSQSESVWLVVTPLAFFSMSLLLGIRFYYLYVAYYSRSLFRAFVFLHEAKKKDKELGKKLGLEVTLNE